MAAVFFATKQPTLELKNWDPVGYRAPRHPDYFVQIFSQVDNILIGIDHRL